MTVYAVAASGGSSTGIQVTNSSMGRSVGVQIIAADVEVCGTGITVLGTPQVDIIDLYAERNQIGVAVNRSGIGSCTIRGGVIGVPDSGVAIEHDGVRAHYGA